MNKITPTFANPQMERVHAIDQRLQTSHRLAQQPLLAHIGRDLAVGIRRDILAQKPHHVYNELYNRSHYEPVAVIKDWRAKLAMILWLARTLKPPQKAPA